LLTCHSKCYIDHFILQIIAFFVESAWKVFTDFYIQKPRKYLFVQRGSRHALFTSDEGIEAEHHFITAYEDIYEERYGKNKKLVTLNMYLTHPMNYAEWLENFAINYSFYLNIISASEHSDAYELGSLMKSGYCTVRSFTMDDYRKLAKYMRFPMIPQATLDRDEQTRKALEKITKEL